MGQETGNVKYSPSTENVVINDSGEKFDDRCIPQLKRTPKHTWAVLMAELCERFSYYGIKAILIIYLTKSLHMTKSDAKANYHAFSMTSYFTGVIGAMMADSYFGKYKTILWSLFFYSIAEVVLTLTTIPSIGQNHSAGPLVGLYIMAIACGNIKPCMAAFGGDQFNQKDTSLLSTFFSLFYMSVNVGAMLTMIFIPMLRTDIKCYGSDCYPLVFGVNTIVIILATVSFMAGSPCYTKKAPEGSVLIRAFKIVKHALKQKRNGSGVKYHYWLYYAQDKYSKNEIEDVRGLLKVLVMYIPLPVFWALFHQQGSSWTLQAEQMDGDLGALGSIRADQMQFLNALLVLMLIPLFDNVIYPMFERCQFPLSPLKKMTIGMTLAAVAFAIAGFMQIKIQDVQSPPTLPGNLQTSVDFINVSPCEMIEVEPDSFFRIAIPYGGHTTHDIGSSGKKKFYVKGTNCFSKSDIKEDDIELSLKSGARQTVFIDINDVSVLTAQVVDHNFPGVNVETADARVRTIYVPSSNTSNIVNIVYKNVLEEDKSVKLVNYTSYDGKHEFILADEYKLQVSVQSGDKYPVKFSKKSIKFGTFGAFTVTLKRPIHQKYSKELVAHVYEDIKSNSVHRLWQLPQYIVITAAEVMFSVTGLEFAYSQAPPSMKSVLQAFWLVTTAFGDLIVVILSLSKPVNGVEKEMFLYGGIMIVVAFIFAIMSYFYTYSDFSGNTPDPIETKQLPDEDDHKLSLSSSTTHL